MSGLLPNANPQRQNFASQWNIGLTVPSILQVFDRNGDGVVSVDEIRAILKTAGKKMSIREVEEMLKNAGIEETELDYEGNTRITFDTSYN